MTARPQIAFFDYADVFEDFYPNYGIGQADFATRWAGSGNHRFLSLLQEHVGDVVWYVLSHAPEVRESRHEVVGCRIVMLRAPGPHRLLWRAFYRPRAAWRWRGAYRPYATVASYLALASPALIRALRRDRPDVLFAQSYSSGRFDVLLLLARALRAPLVAYHAGGRPEGYLAGRVRRRTLPWADLLIASSRDEREMLSTRFGVSDDRLTSVLTPIDTAVFRPLERGEACRAAGLDPAGRYLLFVGRLQDGVKRVSALIRAFAEVASEHADVELVVAGDGPDRERLERWALSAVPGRVRFLGWQETDRLPALYNSAECLVLPSTREGFPTVVGESLACGTPVIATRNGGSREVVRDGETGWLVTPGDDGALARALSLVLADRESATAMRPAARTIAERRLSCEVVAAELQRSFAQAWSGR